MAQQTGLFDVALGRLDGFGKGRRLVGEIQIDPASTVEKESIVAAV